MPETPVHSGEHGRSEPLSELAEAQRQVKALLAANQALERRAAAHAEGLALARRELETISSTVAHDVLAPLRAIDGYARILAEDHASEFSSEAKRCLDALQLNTRELRELIDALLDYARLSAGSMERSLVDHLELVRECIADSARECENRRIEFRVGALVSSHANRALLKRAWGHLISNAIKFSRARAEAVIEIGSRTVPEGCIYHIQDNGVGFNPDQAQKLFGLFQRFHDPREYEGLGAGLAIVQRILHLHGGRMWVEAAPDQGACFSFLLPSEVNDGPEISSGNPPN